MALRGVGSNGRGLDDGTGGYEVFERRRSGTGGSLLLFFESDKLVKDRFIDFDFFKVNDFLCKTERAGERGTCSVDR